MFEVLNLEVARKKFKLYVPSLRAEGNVVLLGRNGSGKSTLLKTLVGFIKPIRGRILLNGREITRLPPSGREIGYLPQEPVRFPFEPWKTIEFFAKKFRVDGKALVSELGLSHLLEKRELSQGENQMINLAVLMMKNPKLLLLDEPTASLDFINKLIFWNLLKNLRTDKIYVTHDPIEASLVADKIYMVAHGRVSGPYDNPLRNRVEAMLDEFNLYRFFQ
ncbi:MAG: ABC transporter ATP-binding protein [Candidatus Caldarchaeum sp.]|nr:ABC transporter ATP-binding protein [Candidatus Caldarchaeum sp.]